MTVAAPARARSLATTTARAPAPAACTEPSAIDWGGIAGELSLASNTDEAHGFSGESDRLLRIAAALADEANVRTPAAGPETELAFDIAALINAARLVPGDRESPARAAHINAAGELLVAPSGVASVDRLLFTDVARPSRGVPREPEEPAAPKPWRTVVDMVSARHATLQHILATWVDAANSSAALGVLALVERVERVLADADKATNHGDHLNGYFPDLSNEYLIVSEVARAVIQRDCDDLTLWAVVYLLDECKRMVDQHTDELMAEHHRGRDHA